jgi:non-haem Fe2+, alpha-ketoglutarate-dependent halogenase
MTTPQQTPSSIELSSEQIEEWSAFGFVGPFVAFSPNEIQGIRNYITNNILAGRPPKGREMDPYYCRHVDDPVVLEICKNRVISNVLSQIYGKRLLLWMSEFINKLPGGSAIRLHQDAGTTLDPPTSVTVWMAIDPATKETGCLQIVQRNITDILPRILSRQGYRADLGGEAHIGIVKDVEMEPGEFVLFRETTLHSSRPNTSKKRRLGFTFRVTIPGGRIKQDTRYFNDYRVVEIVVA